MSRILHTRWLLVLVTILLFANLALIGYHYFSRTDGGRRSSSDWLYRDLGLSQEQESVFRARKDSFMREMRPLWAESRRTKDSLYALLGDSTLDDSAVTAITTRVAELSRQSDELLFRHFRELRKVCTPEQQAAFDTLVPKLVSRGRRNSTTSTSSPGRSR
jgi:protein CpxP